ncbi:MAG: tyrosine-protein phosphatase [Acidimicrobiales bacterium]
MAPPPPQGALASTNGRHLPLEGCFNFRDLGGYRTASGAVVRRGAVWRADSLHRLSATDSETLRRIGIATVVDLRTEQELDHKGKVNLDRLPASYHHLPMVLDNPAPSRFAARGDGGGESFVQAHYKELVDQGAGSIVSLLRLLVDDANHPVVFHCAAGKDRTGVVAAIVLGLLGVGEEEILDDYSYSSRALARAIDWARDNDPEELRALNALPPSMLASDPAEMAEFLAGFRAEHGSYEAYAASAGFGPDELGALRRCLIEPGS